MEFSADDEAEDDAGGAGVGGGLWSSLATILRPAPPCPTPSIATHPSPCKTKVLKKTRSRSTPRKVVASQGKLVISPGKEHSRYRRSLKMEGLLGQAGTDTEPEPPLSPVRQPFSTPEIPASPRDQKVNKIRREKEEDFDFFVFLS